MRTSLNRVAGFLRNSMTEHIAKRITDTCRMTHGNEDAFRRRMDDLFAEYRRLITERSAEGGWVYELKLSSGKAE